MIDAIRWPTRMSRFWPRDMRARVAVLMILLGAMFALVSRQFLEPRSALTGFLSGAEFYVALGDQYPKTVTGGQKLRIPLTVGNCCFRALSFVPRLDRRRMSLENVPQTLPAWQSDTCTLVIYTSGMNGDTTFEFSIVSDGAEARFAVPVTIRADEVQRSTFAGRWRAGGARVKRTVTLTNLPAQKLLRVGPVSENGWSIEPRSRTDRDLELQIEGHTPDLLSHEKQRTLQLRFDLYFRDADVRRARFSLLSVVTGVGRARDGVNQPATVAAYAGSIRGEAQSAQSHRRSRAAGGGRITVEPLSQFTYGSRNNAWGRQPL